MNFPSLRFAHIFSFLLTAHSLNCCPEIGVHFKLLRIIYDNKPESIADLEQMTGRKASNLSRTLRTMANYGLVRFEDGPQGRGRRAVKPVAVAGCVNLTLDIGFGDNPAPNRVGGRQTERIVA